MATQAWPALGTTFAYSTDGTVYTTVGEVLSVGGAGGGEVGERDTTTLASTVKTNMPTIPDNGEVTIELNWDPADTGHQQLRTWKNTPPATLPYFKVTFATTASNTAVFNGWVKSIDGTNAEGTDENLTATVTLRVSGAVTYT